MSSNHLHQQQIWVPEPPERVFAFFSDAFNLNRVTPPWLHFEILTPPPIQMQRGTLIEYRLRVHGWPFRWKTEITDWDPPLRFVDVQRRGPYRTWIHEHRFLPKDGGTLMWDRVEYSLAGGLFEPLIHRWFVRRDVEKIFAYRISQFEAIFDHEPRETGEEAP